jgi:ribosome biogenesis GTPase
VDVLATGCRFRDCAHQGEPGCQVARAIAAGDLSLRRFESWLHLQREQRWAAARADARLRMERASAGKRQARRTGRARP